MSNFDDVNKLDQDDLFGDDILDGIEDEPEESGEFTPLDALDLGEEDEPVENDEDPLFDIDPDEDDPLENDPLEEDYQLKDAGDNAPINIGDLSEEDINNLDHETLLSLVAQTGAVEIDENTLSAEKNDMDEVLNANEEDLLDDETENTVREDSTGADDNGTILNGDELLEDDFELVDNTTDFINKNGEIVVMNPSANEDNFRLQYIDIEKIGYTKRIRQINTNVEDLVYSIRSTGLLEPLVVAPTQTDGVYVLLAGFRRIMACAKAGIRKVPCIVNLKVNTLEIPLVEALYNHSKNYTIKEIVDCIEYLEKQKGIMSASMIEYLLQMNSGEYTKLKDILNDDDDEIVSKLFDGIYNIETAFKKLEQRRKKESAEEKENKKAAKVYEDEEESGADTIVGSGEEVGDGEILSEEELQSLTLNIADLDSVDDEDFEDIVAEGEVEGFEPNKQDYKNRETLDPTLRKSVLARDNNTCMCCGISGQEYVEVFDVHHIKEVFLGGTDDIDNLITVCTCCHKLIHLHGRGTLQIRPFEELSEEEGKKFKRIIKIGNIIRKGLGAKGMKREELKKLDKAETIGRTKPGTGQIAG